MGFSSKLVNLCQTVRHFRFCLGVRLRCSGTLRSVDLYLVSEVSGQFFGPIFEGRTSAAILTLGTAL
jgi:hypothetical protein